MKLDGFNKHYTYEKTGIMWADIKSVDGRFDNVNCVYYYPNETENKRFELVENNRHFGYAHMENGLLYDNSNRGVWKVISD